MYGEHGVENEKEKNLLDITTDIVTEMTSEVCYECMESDYGARVRVEIELNPLRIRFDSSIVVQTEEDRYYTSDFFSDKSDLIEDEDDDDETTYADA